VTGDPRIRPGAEPFSLGDGHVGMLMIHGFTGSPASMRPIGEWLAERHVRVEGVRLPGHGTDLDDLRARGWSEWVEAAAAGLRSLRTDCRTVVAFGQSMGGAIALHLAATRAGEVDAIALANPYVFDIRHAVIPVGRLVLREVNGVANDISITGVEENADARMPVPAIAQMAAMLRLVRRELSAIRQPVVLFRSANDHVIPRGGPAKVLARLGSVRKQLVECPSSFHVVTLDRDAPLVRERLLAFAREIDAARAPA